jgi:hypothetical protein
MPENPEKYVGSYEGDTTVIGISVKDKLLVAEVGGEAFVLEGLKEDHYILDAPSFHRYPLRFVRVGDEVIGLVHGPDTYSLEPRTDRPSPPRLPKAGRLSRDIIDPTTLGCSVSGWCSETEYLCSSILPLVRSQWCLSRTARSGSGKTHARRRGSDSMWSLVGKRSGRAFRADACTEASWNRIVDVARQSPSGLGVTHVMRIGTGAEKIYYPIRGSGRRARRSRPPVDAFFVGGTRIDTAGTRS